MSELKRINRYDLVWAYIAQSLNIGAGIILLPIILRYLITEDVGLWFVFMTLAGVAQFFEFGFQPTLARNMAYIYAGANTLSKDGLPENSSFSKKINENLLNNFIDASRKIYRIVSVLASIVLLTIGTYYINTLLTANQNFNESIAAWIMFSGGYIVNFYYGYFNGLLQGRGDVTQANKVIAASRGSFIVIGAIAVIFGYGLMGLGFASLVASVIGRWLARKYFYLNFETDSIDKIKSPITKEIIITLWHNACRLGAVQVGAFLIQRSNILIASSYLGLELSASYSLTMTLLMTISGFSMVLCQTQTPYMNTLQASGDKKTIACMFGKGVSAAWLTYMLGLVLLYSIGSYAMNLIGSNTMLITDMEIMLLGIILLLEMNHSIAAIYLTTINKIPFVTASLLSGIGIVALSLILIKSYGILGLILSQGIVQIIYNNWKWPMDVVKDLGISYFKAIKMGFNELKR